MLKQCDDKYSCLPIATQWEFLSEIFGKLKTFSSVTKLSFDTNYPITKLYFPQICEVNLTISNWLAYPNLVIQNIATKIINKFKCKFMILCEARVLDPGYKMSLFEYYLSKVILC